MTGIRRSPRRAAARRPYLAEAMQLVTDLDYDPWGSVGASLYETARVTSLAPWLPGHGQRLAWVLDQQAEDGSWGTGPAPYRLLPTLSAVEALLSHVLDTGGGPQRERCAAAAAAGLAAARNLTAAGPWPDTAAIELLVPSLTARINEHLDQPSAGASAHLGPLARETLLAVPPPFLPRRHEQAAQRCRSQGLVPVKHHHTFEYIARHVPGIEVPLHDGLLGSSPAATAAWAANAPTGHREQAVTALSAVAGRYGGLFPETAPFTTVERLWAAAALARPGLPPACAPTVQAWALGIHHAAGVRGAPGLLPDADDTAMTVLVAALAGAPFDPAALFPFWGTTHYQCYIDEDTGSVTANAHALQALTAFTRCWPAASALHRPHRDLVRAWLLEQQHDDGTWTDKWHASPYYATERCVRALAGHTGPGTLDALRSAADWVLDSQQDDGTWGVWGGTPEETAYAVNILLNTPAVADGPGYDRALERAEAALDAVGRECHHHPALWHDKTLYAPAAMIEAEVTAARELLRTRPGAGVPGGSRKRRGPRDS
ncbi:prenyltransferase/squalene oxidase repeat-containing protein [Streptomyces acidiscabies]|uniref:Prenyltransferase/squalene oxidase repeat-containing protein n=1 Tax=Streptomyces acidiscabies TaxID=42234 RepID=A0ABU4MAC1_9ACTN|nr:prenyltransferase/squalene oxidase repeat-containing protein [Streptomyces acidiscabies]MDX3024940.1 prenyltransferase/squalene oxidase repeat-containing protein [Streptomyces acidiscabies]